MRSKMLKDEEVRGDTFFGNERFSYSQYATNKNVPPKTAPGDVTPRSHSIDATSQRRAIGATGP